MTTTTKKPKTGGEIDAWCTKCKLDLGHRIIAMVGDVVKRVECRTCNSHHNYHKPKSERAAAPAKRAAGAAPAAGVAKEPRAKAPGRETAAQRAERELVQAWEHAIAGKPPAAFKPYRISQTFGAGELIKHPKFGDGVVQRVIDRGKVEVLFQDGARTMAHGQA